MEQYISKDALVRKINNWIKDARRKYTLNKVQFSLSDRLESLENLLSFLNTIEVKEVQENKLPNPRFPHLDNIVEKVFGAGNLDVFEYEEAEQLVLLAKEELLKDLDVKEVDLEKEIKDYIYALPHAKTGVQNEWRLYWHEDKVMEIAKYFYELGLKNKE